MISNGPEVSPHISAIMEHLKGSLPATIRAGLAVAPAQDPPYIVVYPDSGVIGWSRLCLERSDIAMRFYLHAVGTGPEQCLWVMDKARGVLSGHRPEVPGRTVTRISQTHGPQMITSDNAQSLGPIKRDQSEQPPYQLIIAEFTFSSQRGETHA